MSTPSMGPEDPSPTGAVADLATTPAPKQEPPAASRRQGLPGGRVVTVATLAVAVAAVVEVLATDAIGRGTGITLVAASSLAAVLTRVGDLSLPAMMPPLAFLAAALVAGQALVPEGTEPWWTRQALMLLDVLGQNAPWVLAATVVSVAIAAVRHFVSRARARRSG